MSGIIYNRYNKGLDSTFIMNKEIRDYFNIKKCQLSSQSENGDSPKKQCEEPTIIDDVFKEGLTDPNCLAILLNCLRNLEIKVNSIFNDSEEWKESRIKGDKQLEEVQKSIKFISEQFESYENDRKEKDEVIQNLQNDKILMEKKIENLEKKVDRQEQYSRRNCILIHGIEEKNDENTDNVVVEMINDNLGVNITENDLDRSHRLGKKDSNRSKPRPIIVKLARYNTRSKIFYNKKKLKGKNISITESLTKVRMQALKEAQEEKGFKNVWSADGRIMFKDGTKAEVYYD